VADVLADRAAPSGRVLVIDELGFHQATSVAELLADRGCAVTVTTNGMVVGQDLGITLDLEHWNFRAAARHIEQRTDLVAMGCNEGAVSFLHHPTATNVELAYDWVVTVSPPAPADSLYLELDGEAGRGFELHRVGDCVAPRRAHAAVVEGQRVGAAL